MGGASNGGLMSNSDLSPVAPIVGSKPPINITRVLSPVVHWLALLFRNP